MSTPLRRTASEPRDYFLALQGVQCNAQNLGLEELRRFADAWPQGRPRRLEDPDLCSVAWLHKGVQAFDVWSEVCPPSANLLLIATHDLAVTQVFLKNWHRVRTALLGESLEPWRSCFLHLAIVCKAPEACRELSKAIGVNSIIPLKTADVQYWGWNTGPFDTGRFDYSYPLHVALREGAFKEAEWLLQNGADPWLKDSEGRSALETLEHHIEERTALESLRRWGGHLDLSEHRAWAGKLRAALEKEVLELGVKGPSEGAGKRRM